MQDKVLFFNGLIFSRVANAVLFQLGWFGCVVGGDNVALPLTVVLMVIHYSLISGEPRELVFIALVGCIGWSADTLFALAGVLLFTESGAGLIPAWLVCLWLLFATTLRHSLSWLSGRYLLAALFGAGGGVLSYLAGARLSPSVTLGSPLVTSLMALGLFWGLLLPVLLSFLRRWRW